MYPLQPRVTSCLARRTQPMPRGIFALIVGLVCQPLLAVESGRPRPIDELKALSVEELMQVTVTSVSRYEEKLSNVASAIQVLSYEDIRRSTAYTIPEALRLANNLNVAQKNPHDWAISARGFNANVGNKLLVMMDGRSVYTPLFAGVFWNAQDYVLEDIDRLEVISGPGGTQWGANAVNGVINVITKTARQSQGLYFDAGFGNELERATSVRYGGRIAPNVHFRVYGKYFSQDAGALTSGQAAADGWQHGQGGFRLDAEPNAEDSLTLQGDLYGGDLGIQSGETARMAGGNLLGRWSRTLSANSGIQVQFYYDRTHLSVPFAATQFAPAGFLRDDLDTYDLDVQHTLGLGERHRLIWGAGYRFTHDVVTQQAPNVAYLPPRLDQSLYSIFLKDEYRATENWAFTVGTKLEHNDFTGLEIEPSLRAQWAISPTQMVWSAVSRAVRMPSRFDRHLYEPAPPLSLIQGGPDFDSETVIAYELGYRAQLGTKVSGSISVFYNDYDRLRSWGITPVTILPVVFENNLEAEAHGFEATVDVQMAGWWRLNGGFNLLKEDVRVKPGKFDLQNALDETADPEHQLSLRSVMDLPGRIELDALFRWVGELRNNNGGTPGSVPAYAELDLRIGWHMTPSVVLSVIGRNLLHDRHPEYGPPGVNREELQRSVFGKVTCRF